MLFAIYIQFCRMLLILLACCSVLLVLGNRLLAIWQDSTEVNCKQLRKESYSCHVLFHIARDVLKQHIR